MARRSAAAAVLATALVASTAAAWTTGATADDRPFDPASSAYEVWTIDQTDTATTAEGLGYGGLLHIYDGAALEADAAAASAQTIDLGAAASRMCFDKTGAWPVRPHMLAFNGGDKHVPGGNRYAAIAWVVSGHVLFLDAATRQPIDCLRTTPGAGGARQAHAIWPTPDQQWVLVANQNGKLLERISTNWTKERFKLEPDATLSLYEGVTPSGAPKQDPLLRPDNAPICPRVTNDGQFTFVSLRGGGAFVVDHVSEPMRIVAEYDKDHVGDNGCGQVQAGNRMFVNAGAGAPERADASEVYAFDLAGLSLDGTPPNTPAPKLVYAREGDVDAHGVAVTLDERYVLAGDRTQNDVTVIDTTTDVVVNRFSVTGAASSDPAPDLFDLSPDGTVLYASLRGPSPLSGGHDAVGSTPGIGVVQLYEGGTAGALTGVAPASRSDGKSADTHAVGVRSLAD